MLEITSKDDQVLFYELTKKFGITAIWPTDETIRAIKIIHTIKPTMLLEIAAELSDEETLGYTHGKRATYVNHRCHGILCKHANKMHARERGNLTRLNDGLDEALDALCEGHEIGMPESIKENQDEAS